MWRDMLVGFLTLVSNACWATSHKEEIVAPKEVVDIVRSSGRCGGKPVIIRYEQRPLRVEAECAIRATLGSATILIVAECAEGHWQISGVRETLVAGPCGSGR